LEVLAGYPSGGTCRASGCPAPSCALLAEREFPPMADCLKPLKKPPTCASEWSYSVGSGPSLHPPASPHRVTAASRRAVRYPSLRRPTRLPESRLPLQPLHPASRLYAAPCLQTDPCRSAPRAECGSTRLPAPPHRSCLQSRPHP